MPNTNLIDQIDDLLPQTQCTRCGYPSCHQYALAIAHGDAAINQCPPGGDAGIASLANLLGRQALPLNPANGSLQPRELAVINEEACIGCALCIKACPVDAIIGANKMLHTVIAAECTGCDLCIPVCPVDCISTVIDDDQTWSEERQLRARKRYQAHGVRQDAERLAREERLKKRGQLLHSGTS